MSSKELEPTLQEIQQFKEKLEGAGLPAEYLFDLVNTKPIMIIHFLRHLGCIYCKYNVEQLYKLKQANPRFPDIYFVHQGSVERGEEFFKQYFPGASHISDPKLKLYRLFKIRSLGGLQLFNPKMILKGFKLSVQGYWNKIVAGDDIFLLSGTFLFHQGKLIWVHKAKYAGDEPKWERLAGQKPNP